MLSSIDIRVFFFLMCVGNFMWGVFAGDILLFTKTVSIITHISL